MEAAHTRGQPPPGAPPPRLTAPPYPAPPSTAHELHSCVVAAILSGLIAIRTILVALGADMKAGFGTFIHSVTQPFDLPFLMLFGKQAKATSQTPTLEIGSLVAISVYLLFAWVIAKVLEIIMAPRAIRATA